MAAQLCVELRKREGKWKLSSIWRGLIKSLFFAAVALLALKTPIVKFRWAIAFPSILNHNCMEHEHWLNIYEAVTLLNWMRNVDSEKFCTHHLAVLPNRFHSAPSRDNDRQLVIPHPGRVALDLSRYVVTPHQLWVEAAFLSACWEWYWRLCHSNCAGRVYFSDDAVYLDDGALTQVAYHVQALDLHPSNAVAGLPREKLPASHPNPA